MRLDWLLRDIASAISLLQFIIVITAANAKGG